MAADNVAVPASETNPVGAQVEREKRKAAVAPAGPAGAFDWMAALRSAGQAAFLAGVLAFFFIGMSTDIAPGGLVLTFRWLGLLYAVALVFFGRLLLEAFILHAAPASARAIAAIVFILVVIGMMAYDVPGSRQANRILVGAVLGVLVVAVVYGVARWRSGARASGKTKRAEAASGVAWLARASTLALLAVAAVLPFLITTFFPAQQRQYIDLAILIMTYVMLGWGLNIVVGLAGLLDLGYVAFYAVGAYSFALLSTHFEFIGFWIALPLAGMLAALWGLILGFPVLRLRGDYLAIVTLAFGEIIRIVLLNWYQFTNGPNGISGIPKPTLFGLEFTRGEGGFADVFGLEYSTIHRFMYLYYIILILALVTNFVTMRLRRLPIGRAWEALREDEIACRSLGINTTTTKLTAFAIGAMFAGFAGSFFAARQGFVSPESFVYLESAIVLSIVVLGGMGSLGGIAVAALVMIGGTEILRELTFLKIIFGDNFTPELYRMLLFGLAIVIVMLWKPRGFVGSREPTAFLFRRKAVSASFAKEGHG
jgi:branched-chain amino acid transport system permease protein